MAASAADAFDVVIPSLPGHGFSAKPTATGWDPIRIARAWIVLMQRLGYTRYVAQGGDWGNAVTEQMALLAPPGLLGIHTNMPATIPDDIAKALQLGDPPPAGLSADERNAWDQLDYFLQARPGLRPGDGEPPADALRACGFAGRPGRLDARPRRASYELIARVFDGQPEGLTRDDILDNVTLYWLTNTAVSSARLYWESKLAFFAPKGVAIPVAVSVFPDEIYAAPRSWAERAYPKLIHFNRLDKGGHFAAWEQPAALLRRAPRGVPIVALGSRERRATTEAGRLLEVPCACGETHFVSGLDGPARPGCNRELHREEAAMYVRPSRLPFHARTLARNRHMESAQAFDRLAGDPGLSIPVSVKAGLASASEEVG